MTVPNESEDALKYDNLRYCEFMEMIGRIADQIASSNLNITDMTNKSRDTIAINLIDLEDKPSDQLIDDIRNIDHVLSVRLCG